MHLLSDTFQICLLVVGFVGCLNMANVGAIALDTFQPNQMPSLYTADDYRECLKKSYSDPSSSLSSASYCMVYVEIQADNSIPMWQYIWNYQNSHRFRYRHDQLYRGICTSNMKTSSAATERNSKYSNLVNTDQSKKSDNMQMFELLYEISRQQKSIEQYQVQLHEHINAEMQEMYNLSAKTLVTYCDNPREPLVKGSWYKYTIYIFFAIAILNILSTIYDFCQRPTNPSDKDLNVNYYERNHKASAKKYLTSFSMYRNYRRILVSHESPTGKDLSFVDGIRTTMFGTMIHEHATFMHFAPIGNSSYVEYIFSTPLVLFLIHLVVCLEVFFVMAGLMLFMKFDKSQFVTARSSLGECLKVYGRMLISRYLRFIPSVLLLMLFASNIWIHLMDGPFWRLMMEPNVVLCHHNWRSTLLMTSDLASNSYCLPHTWYITKDFQLYAIFLALLVIVAKYPKWKKYIYTVVGILGLTVPSIVSYILKLESIPTLAMEQSRHMFLKDVETMIHMYASTYGNLNAFFVGILCGEIYMKYLKHDKYKQLVRPYLRKLTNIGWISIGLIWYLGTKLFLQKHSIWTALFAMLHKHLSVVIVATFGILRHMCGYEGLLKWPISRFLGRISYQVYLWHYIVLYTIFAKYEQPIQFSFIPWFSVVLATCFLSVFVSVITAVMWEYPIAELSSVVDLKKKPKTVKNA